MTLLAVGLYKTLITMLYLQLGGRGGPVGKMFQPRASEG